VTAYHINVFYSDDDGGYIADIPDLEACSAFAPTARQALTEVMKAREARLVAARDAGKPIPGASLPARDLHAVDSGPTAARTRPCVSNGTVRAHGVLPPVHPPRRKYRDLQGCSNPSRPVSESPARTCRAALASTSTMSLGQRRVINRLRLRSGASRPSACQERNASPLRMRWSTTRSINSMSRSGVFHFNASRRASIAYWATTSLSCSISSCSRAGCNATGSRR
jgi:predicted RNase H-like HicB family nuclease